MDTRTEIIRHADHLIRTVGYNAFSYADISQELGVKNAAIHYHFPRKSDLGVAVIEWTLKGFEINRERWDKSEPEARLRTFIRMYRNIREDGKVCFMGALGPAFNDLPEPMQESLTKASETIQNWVADVLEDGLKTGDFKFNESVEEKADTILSSLTSSLILSRVTGRDVTGNARMSILASAIN